METELAYLSGGEEVLTRLRRFLVDQDQDLVMAAMSPPSGTVAAFAARHEAGPCDYPDPDERAKFWDAFLHERSAIHDDSIPSAYLSELDQGLYGGLIGGRARFLCDTGNGWISSMVEPILSDLSELEGLAMDMGGEWHERYAHQLGVFAEAARGRFGLSHFILIDGLNFVFELVGATQTYLETIERPELVRQAIDFAFELNVSVQRTFFKGAPNFRAGTCSNMVQWIPGRIVSESVDPFHMASVDYFEQWGRENVERMFAEFDGGVTHIHGNGRHLLEAVSTVEGLKAIWLGDDRGYPPSFEVIEELKGRVGDMPLLLTVPFEAFLEALQGHRLTGGVFYNVGGVPDADTANRVMEQVRAYRR